ncbi:MAG: hypothetical protein E2O35_00720, partial [Proteobacteria bacterium]
MLLEQRDERCRQPRRCHAHTMVTVGRGAPTILVTREHSTPSSKVRSQIRAPIRVSGANLPAITQHPISQTFYPVRGCPIIPPPMPEELPKFIDPRRLADQAGSLTGFISPGRLPRVVAPYRLKRPVAVSLSARIDGPWRTHLGGQIKAEVEATCQRCLGVMSVIIEHAIDVIAVHADSSSPVDADDAVDVIATANGVFDVERFVEDEVVLACPMFP